jgi:hypothetical protein
MFRLHFEPKLGLWVIQFLYLGLFWRAVRREAEEQGRPAGSILSFKSIEDAENYVTATGIGLAYDRWAAKGRNAVYVLGVER